MKEKKKTLISFPLDIYLEVDLLDHKLVLFLIFWGTLHTLYYNGRTNLHSHQQCTRDPFSLHPHLLPFVFLIKATLTGLRWNLVVVPSCISLMISDIQHLFIYLLAICMSPFEKCLFRSSVYFYYLFIYLFLLFWLCRVFVVACRIFSCSMRTS